MSTAIDTGTPTVAEPGVYVIPVDAYHADPVEGGSLSSSGARSLLPPGCPARFRWELDHPGNGHSHPFDLGHAAHRLVLGDGPEIVRIDADSWRTKAAREQRDACYADGAVPLLADDHDQVLAMAKALREHPIAAALFSEGRGAPEQTLVWRDGRTGVMRRARLDWLPAGGRGRLIIPDYKTCHSADPEALSRAAYQFGYHQQADWYRAGAQALGLAGDDAAFVFVCQEKQPPWLVSVIELDSTAMRIGAARNRRAIDIYAHCTETGRWPAYVDGVALLALPRWAEIEEGEHLT